MAKTNIRTINGKKAVFIGNAFQNWVEDKKPLNLRGRKAAGSAEKSWYEELGMSVKKAYEDWKKD
jgi:hypothetical protein